MNQCHAHAIQVAGFSSSVISFVIGSLHVYVYVTVSHKINILSQFCIDKTPVALLQVSPHSKPRIGKTLPEPDSHFSMLGKVIPKRGTLSYKPFLMAVEFISALVGTSVLSVVVTADLKFTAVQFLADYTEE